MKKILLTLSLPALLSMVIASAVHQNPDVVNFGSYAEKPDFKSEWKKVDSLEQKGLTKSALKVIEEIYVNAKSGNNAPQLVKAIIYRLKFRDKREEKAFESEIIEIKKEISEAGFPLQNILHSSLAEMYWWYYERHRWTMLERSSVKGIENDDMETWDLKRLAEEITYHYEQSLLNEEGLKRLEVETFEEVIITGENSDKLRPFLYDFLAHRAIDFFTNGEAGLTQAGDGFKIDDPAYLAPFDEFKNFNIPPPKYPLSFQYKALVLLQKLIAFHHGRNTTALIDADLKRIKYVEQNGKFGDKEKHYMVALKQLKNQFTNNAASTEIDYEIALVHQQNATKYNPLMSDDFKWERKTAAEICKSAIERFPKSFGSNKCQDLLNQIESPSLSFTMERVNLSQKAFRGSLTYTNLDSATFRIVKLNEQDPILNRRLGGENLLNYYLKQGKVLEWSEKLVNDGDYQAHSTEISIEPLKFGRYALLTSESNDFSQNSAIYANEFWVSNLSYTFRTSESNAAEFYVFDRHSGKQLEGVKITVYNEGYDYVKRDNITDKVAELTSDKNGYAIFKATSNKRNYHFMLSYQNDLLMSNRQSYLHHYSRNQNIESIKTHFYTDRAIYRPGQTIYFKGIMINSKGEDTREIIAGRKATVRLYDANRQEVSKLSLVTNEFGTFSGSFTAPSGGLNGMMTLAEDYGEHNIRVEEYKRPRFEVVFDPVTGSYKLGQNVKFNGKATSYSGAGVDGAKVSYRIVRNAHYRHYWWMYRWSPPSVPETEIKQGELITNDKGEFEIEFNSIGDGEQYFGSTPIYNFSIYADVTDITGETQSSSQTVSVSNKALLISATIPDELDKQSKNKINIVTTNLNGEFEPGTVEISIQKLNIPDRIFRRAMWSRTDRTNINEQEFRENYPYDEYMNENDQAKWKIEKTVYQSSVNTGENKAITLQDLAGWDIGQYQVIMKATDVFGQAVEWKKYFTVFSSTGNEVPSNKLDWFSALNESGEPGEKAAFLIGSAAKDVNVLFEIEHRNQIIKSEWISLSNEQKKIEIPIEEKFRGNFSYHLTFVKFGRFFQHTQSINVPYTNKQLDFTFESFRDKLLPGANEKWRITIHDNKGEKVAAEMAASLYDASLDAFVANNWHFNIYPFFSSFLYWNGNDCFTSATAYKLKHNNGTARHSQSRSYNQLNWFGYGYYSYGYFVDGIRTKSIHNAPAMMEMAESAEEYDVNDAGFIHGKDVKNLASDKALGANTPPPPAPNENPQLTAKARSNFNETAFFYPQLATNENGEVVIEFTIPESLTKWKLLGFAHTNDLKGGILNKELITQKDVMVVTNPPRFFREGDELTLAAKVTNLKDRSLEGMAEVTFYNTLTNEDITAQLLKDAKRALPFTAESEKSTSISWKISVPEGFSAITYKVVAQSGQFTDGEQRMIPVLTNRMLVTESMPLPVKGDQVNNFTFKKLLSSASSTTLRHERVTLEFTSNPAWYAVQALPYLMEYPYECAEQLFSRYYSNSIASHIANSSPKIKAVFDAWKNIDKEALVSNLEKNQELKSLLLEETPWVMDAINESERKKRVGLLFDLNKMGNEMQTALRKLGEMQSPNGGWPWFKGMKESRYITQHVVTGMGHLDHLGVQSIKQDKKTSDMLKNAILYLDNVIREDYEWLKTHKTDLSANNIGSIQIQYLYARSYFREIAVQHHNREAFNYYKGQAKKYWVNQNNYLQGMIALGLNRFDEKTTAAEIMASLKENALTNDEMGMYWKKENGYYWYQAPIERQALFIEAFDEVSNDMESVEEMKIWLLKQKQTQDWKTTKATTEACYALLLRGTDLLENTHQVIINLGGLTIDPANDKELKKEAGTGYFKKSWGKGEIKPEMGNITVSRIAGKQSNAKSGVAWGALYWQYFEQLDKITPHETPLKLKKQLFIERNTPTGPIIETISEDSKIKNGDKVKVRIELRVDRDMEYVHMKDMRASGFEPINVLSGYRYQDGLGYYESTRDAATNFFFDYLPKGTYVFEYPLRANIAGNFSNGITTIQCMYAPEFTSHSEGIRINIQP